MQGKDKTELKKFELPQFLIQRITITRFQGSKIVTVQFQSSLCNF